MNGIINVHKPTGITSFDVVRKIKKISNVKKVGHAGTLDPEASGVLLVCIG
ncbi:MAG: tRNA pseudouridine(55) synthase TruB, partial [Clostridium sp.]|nr:tRNA pseudouridine(55) synthase TruB [Clostridium sp.]